MLPLLVSPSSYRLQPSLLLLLLLLLQLPPGLPKGLQLPQQRSGLILVAS
jgi:hypothetical protein